MKNWNLVNCGNVIDVRDGTHDSPKYVENGFPLITSKNLINGKLSLNEVSYISQFDFDNINKRSKVDIGDILYSMIGSIGNYALIEEEPNFAIKNVALFKFNNDLVYNKFFYYLLNSSGVRKQIENQQKGGTQKFVSLSILRNLQIPLPPLTVQQEIAAILDAADAYRQKTKALIDKYDQLAQSLFLDMFGDTRYNEKNWPTQNLEDLCSSIIDCPHSTPKYVNEITDYPCIRTTELKNGSIDWSSMKYLDKEGYLKRTARIIPEEGDIIYGREGTFGEAVIVPPCSNISLGQRVMLFRPKYEFISSIFLHSVIRSPGVYYQALCVNTGSTVGHVNVSDIKKFQIILPPITLQNLFAERIQLIEVQKKQAQASLQKAEALFNSLLQRAFSGELVG